MAAQRPISAGEEDLAGTVLLPMTRRHLDAVLEIEQEGFTNPWRRSDFEFALDRDGSHCVVAQQEGRVVGYAVGFFVLAEYHLADFAVHAECRGRGLGKALLVQLMEDLSARPVDYVALEVRVSNQTAIGLYKGLDFQTVAMRRDYYSMPTEDALVMIRAVRGSLSDWTAGIRGF